jgi:hypothetical protein
MAWLAQNAKKPGVITLPSGLQYVVNSVGGAGRGSPSPKLTSEVDVKWRTTLIDGTEVDPLAQYIESTEQLVLAKWGGELARITRLPTQQARATSLKTLLDQTRTPKESFILMSLATVALLKAGR